MHKRYAPPDIEELSRALRSGSAASHITLRQHDRLLRACAVMGVSQSRVIRDLVVRWTDVILGDTEG